MSGGYERSGATKRVEVRKGWAELRKGAWLRKGCRIETTKGGRSYEKSGRSYEGLRNDRSFRKGRSYEIGRSNEMGGFYHGTGQMIRYRGFPL